VNAPAVVVLGSTSRRTCRRLVAAAERIVPQTGARTVVFSGWSGRDGPSEAEHMRAIWRGAPDVELVLEETASTTAENAARSLPLLQERGITRAVVICAPVHLPRARGIFQRVYRRQGITVSFRVARVAPTPGALLWELGALTVAARQVRSAHNELERL
jgi:uncharacterized SAM-binding protein YcdF (DUF218 family)